MKKNVRDLLGVFPVFFFIAVFLTSCSDEDYINVIPRNSMALVSIDLQEITDSYPKTTAENADVIKSVLKIDDVSDCGIDLASKIYIFESAEGNIGLVARVADDGNLEEWISKLAGQGICTHVTERKDCRFTLIKNNWVLGFSSGAVLVMGPIVPAQQAEIQHQIIKYLNNDEKHSIKESPVFEKLNAVDSPVAVTARMSALPEKFAVPFTFGIPSNADASQVMLVAGMSIYDGCLYVKGETFSFNRQIDSAVKESRKIFCPIQGKYIPSMSAEALAGVFMNVDGGKFIKLLHENKSFQAILAGINTAIDIDNIIRCIDGDLAVIMQGYDNDKPSLQLLAQLGRRDFLADVDYWKESCPSGSSIGDWGKDAYYYTDGIMNFYFGVSPDNQFYSGKTPEQARMSVAPAAKAVYSSVQDSIKGKRMCMVLSISNIAGSNAETSSLWPLVKSLLGGADTVVLSFN